MSERRQYHQSMINMFQKCPKQYMFRYLEGIKTPPSGALAVGGAVDAGSTRNYIQKVETGVDMPLAEVLEVASTDFDIRAKETEWKDEDPGEQKDLTIKLLTAHHEQIAPTVDPATVQENFVIETDAGYDLGGTIDLTTKDDLVIDTKTSGKRYDADAVNLSNQPVLYDYAYEALHGKKPRGFRFDVLVKTKSVTIQQVEGQVSDEARLFLFDAIDNMDRAISAGIFMPADESSWVCSKKWCGYWDRCKGKSLKKPSLPAPVSVKSSHPGDNIFKVRKLRKK
jgi:CRISPR/Cas system-associated exonuclease Cas4 (RecB family)